MGLLARGLLPLIVAAGAVAGCGAEDDYANEPRPPAPIVVTAALVGDDLSVSPNEFGAGMVTMVVTNQTGAARKLQLETDEVGGSQAGIRRLTESIAPGGTGELKADLRQGRYRLQVVDGNASARLRVGPPRDSSQDQLLLP